MSLKMQDSWKRCPVTNCPCPNHEMAIPPFSPYARDTFEEPAFHHLLHTNNPPLDSEGATIHLLIDALQSKTAPICDSMSELETSRAEVCSQIDERMLALKEEEERQLSDAITRHKAVLSPIRRLPSEILSHIFLQSIPLPNEPFVPEDWLWQMERVCKTWRTTILGYPHFGSFIAFHVSQYSVFNNLQAQCYVSRLKTQLSRTQQFPLSVSLFDNSRARTRSMASGLFEVLEGSASRIQELHLQLGVKLARNLRTSTFKGSFDSLYYLRIDLCKNGTPEIPISTFEQCPNLRHLEMHCVSRPPAHPFKDLELSWVPSAVVLPDYAEAQLQTIRAALEEFSSWVNFTGNVE